MRIAEKILDILYPPVCLLCGGRGEICRCLCKECYGKYVSESFLHCDKCGQTARNCTCPGEYELHTRKKISGKSAVVLTFFVNSKHRENTDRVTEKMIFALKSKGSFSDFFADELCRTIKSEFSKSEEDISEWTITYAPRSIEKFYEFGVDQGEELARCLAKRLHIKHQKLFLRSASEEQKNLSATERKVNASESMVPIKRGIKKGGKYLIVDDIITTGSTVSAAARYLYYYGAAAVFPVAIARTKLF